MRIEDGQNGKGQQARLVGGAVANGMTTLTNGTTRSEIIKEQTMQRLRAAGFCFEGERFETRTRADSRFAGTKSPESADSQDGSKS